MGHNSNNNDVNGNDLVEVKAMVDPSFERDKSKPIGDLGRLRCFFFSSSLWSKSLDGNYENDPLDHYEIKADALLISTSPCLLLRSQSDEDLFLRFVQELVRRRKFAFSARLAFPTQHHLHQATQRFHNQGIKLNQVGKDALSAIKDGDYDYDDEDDELKTKNSIAAFHASLQELDALRDSMATSSYRAKHCSGSIANRIDGRTAVNGEKAKRIKGLADIAKSSMATSHSLKASLAEHTNAIKALAAKIAALSGASKELKHKAADAADACLAKSDELTAFFDVEAASIKASVDGIDTILAPVTLDPYAAPDSPSFPGAAASHDWGLVGAAEFVLSAILDETTSNGSGPRTVVAKAMAAAKTLLPANSNPLETGSVAALGANDHGGKTEAIIAKAIAAAKASLTESQLVANYNIEVLTATIVAVAAFQHLTAKIVAARTHQDLTAKATAALEASFAADVPAPLAGSEPRGATSHESEPCVALGALTAQVAVLEAFVADVQGIIAAVPTPPFAGSEPHGATSHESGPDRCATSYVSDRWATVSSEWPKRLRTE